MEVFHRALQHLNRRGDGDTIDHLSATTTVTILIVSALLVSTKQYLGQPIQCWVPAQFTSAMEQYTENYCYVQNTYWIEEDSAIPDDIRKRQTAQLSYYQWVPFILLGQAALFYAPRIIWRTMSTLSGINFHAIHTMAHDCQISDSIKGEHLKKALANYIMSAIDLNRSFNAQASLPYRLRYLCPLVALILTKSLYFANAAGQLFLLNAILGGSGNEGEPTGVNLIKNLINGTDWSTTGLFPRVTLCDFEVRVLGNVHRYTVQCVLMINMFNEKLFASLWIWTLLVAVASLLSLAYWSFQMFLRRKRLRFVTRLLPMELSSENKTTTTNKSIIFVDDYLDIDGVFMLRLIDNQVGSVLASQLVTYFYEQFTKREQQKHSRTSDTITSVKTESTTRICCNASQFFENRN